MKKIVKLFVVIMAVFVMSATVTTVQAKSTRKIQLTVGGKSCKKIKIAGMKKKSKVKIKISKKSVVNAKQIGKTNKVKIVAKKNGKAKITLTFIKKGKKRKVTYSVVVKNKKLSAKNTKRKTDKELSKEAFNIQNKYRKEAGAKELEWSDELYEFCVFRIKNSGYDKHANLGRDTNQFFGLFAETRLTMFAENMVGGGLSPKDAMLAWKKSEGHRRNYLSKDHKCGAIAYAEGMWIAIFWNGPKSDFTNWRDYKFKKYTVKRYDKQSDQFVGNVSIAYYDVSDKDNRKVVSLGEDKKENYVVLEIGKTYRFYEQRSGGYEKANSINITVTENDDGQIVLSN